MKLCVQALLMLFLGFAGCGMASVYEPDRIESRYQAIADELIQLSEDDQKYEQIVIRGEVPDDRDVFFQQKANLMIERGGRCSEIFDEIGFPDYDMVGKDASDAFWLLVQHSDHDPEFQERVATAMIPAVERGAADGSQLAYLMDRVRINTGRGQLYGTQVDYEHSIGRAFPKTLESAEFVDERRSEVGLEPLFEYMNTMCEVYFMMNERQLSERGVNAAYQYAIGFDSW